MTLGKPEGFPSFGWDNEYGAKSMEVKVGERERAVVWFGRIEAGRWDTRPATQLT